MDQNEAHGGGDPNEQFHRNEAISAVVDEGFLGEDDDDYEDLYNDVNVGEGFLQSLRKNEDLRIKNEEEAEKKSEPVPQPVHRPQVADNVAGGGVNGGGEMKYESNNGDSSRIEPVAGGLKVELGHSSGKVGEVESVSMNNNHGMSQQQSHHVETQNMGNLGNAGGDGYGVNAFGSGGTVLFVGDLHWWTTDAEIESELCKYGQVKEVKFFDEKASGKSKGYCQVEFYDPSAATACKEGMNGHVFNGRPCVVAYASPYSVKRMGEAQVNRNQQIAQSSAGQPKRGPGDLPVKPGVNNTPAGGSFQSSGDNNRGFGRGNWGRGNGQGMAGRGPGGRGGRGMMGNGFGPLPMMHPQAMMGQGFDPSFGGPMGRMGSYGGFPGAPTPPFSGMLPSFPAVGNVGLLTGLAPHVNPAFFGRGMGMMPTGGADGPNMGMWSDPNMSGWGGDEHGGRVGESSYGEEAVSDQQYREGSQDRGKDRDRETAYERDLPREKDAVLEDEWLDRRHRDERVRERSCDHERGRDRYRDERDRYGDHHRYKEVEPEYDEEWDRARSSRAHGKSRLGHEDEHRSSRSRDADYGKRRRVTAE